MKISKAIILAAGRSKRLGSLTADKPKCLLTVGDSTILTHQIKNLNACGIDDITIVTGFCGEMIKKSCGSFFRYVANPEFDKTNSIYSLWLGLKNIKDGIVVLNSDVLFHPGILENLLNSPQPDTLAICFHDSLGDEEMKVQVKNGRIVDISKAMDLNVADGENVGIVKFSAGGLKVLFEMLDNLIRDGVVNAWAPLAFQKICSSHNLHAVSTQGLPWIEIDFPEDLERARREIYPMMKDKIKGLRD